MNTNKCMHRLGSIVNSRFRFYSFNISRGDETGNGTGNGCGNGTGNGTGNGSGNGSGNGTGTGRIIGFFFNFFRMATVLAIFPILIAFRAFEAASLRPSFALANFNGTAINFAAAAFTALAYRKETTTNIFLMK